MSKLGGRVSQGRGTLAGLLWTRGWPLLCFAVPDNKFISMLVVVQALEALTYDH